MVQRIEDYSLQNMQNISNRINLRRSQASILCIMFLVFLPWRAMHHVSMYFLRKTVFHFLPRETISCFREKNTIFPDNTRKIMCRRSPFWKDHLFRRFEENITFPQNFKERSSFIFRPRCKIIFSGKRIIIFLDNTRKIKFQRNFVGKTIFSGRLGKENMVFRAVISLQVGSVFFKGLHQEVMNNIINSIILCQYCCQYQQCHQYQQFYQEQILDIFVEPQISCPWLIYNELLNYCI